jgi:UDP-N-acetylmuramate dehydrogenase
MSFIIEQQVALKDRNTLALPATAAHFCTVRNVAEARQAISFANEHGLPITVLGGGSNIVLVGDVAGLVMAIAIKGVELLATTADTVSLRVGAGESWSDFVEYSLSQSWFGLENLALIPGTVGAAPIQNVGAYGVEICQLLDSVEAINRHSGELKIFSNSQCQFGYRHSVFKAQERDQWIITHVTLTLSTTPDICLDYPDLQQALTGVTKPTPAQVFEAVCQLRRHKLPDPDQIPNAGSFFKNPLLSENEAQVFLNTYPGCPSYRQADGRTKLAAAWLIDQAGWKGFRDGPVGVHERQALVIIHCGKGQGSDILNLAHRIADDVKARFGVDLELEPTVIGV